jgi:hypothetical protein
MDLLGSVYTKTKEYLYVAYYSVRVKIFTATETVKSYIPTVQKEQGYHSLINDRQFRRPYTLERKLGADDRLTRSTMF